MVRKPRSEYEMRDKLANSGYTVVMSPGSLGAIDMVAIKGTGIPGMCVVMGVQVKETRKNAVYLSKSEVESIKSLCEGAGWLAQLAVKFKARNPREKPVWKFLDLSPWREAPVTVKRVS